MLVVKVELHAAETGSVKELSRMYIINDGTGTAEHGNYTVKVGRNIGRVEGYPRLAHSVWRLVSNAIGATCAAYKEKEE